MIDECPALGTAQQHQELTRIESSNIERIKSDCHRPATRRFNATAHYQYGIYHGDYHDILPTKSLTSNLLLLTGSESPVSSRGMNICAEAVAAYCSEHHPGGAEASRLVLVRKMHFYVRQ